MHRPYGEPALGGRTGVPGPQGYPYTTSPGRGKRRSWAGWVGTHDQRPAPGCSAIQPVSGAPFAMGHGVHLDRFRVDAVEDHERESPYDMLPKRSPRTPHGRCRWDLPDAIERCVDRSHKLHPEAGPLGLVPLRRGTELGLRLGGDKQAEGHSLERRERMRDRTSAHSGACSPRAAAARCRWSSSAIHACSQSPSGCPSRLAKTSVAMRTRSCSGSPSTSRRSCWADFDMELGYQPFGRRRCPSRAAATHARAQGMGGPTCGDSVARRRVAQGAGTRREAHVVQACGQA